MTTDHLKEILILRFYYNTRLLSYCCCYSDAGAALAGYYTVTTIRGFIITDYYFAFLYPAIKIFSVLL